MPLVGVITERCATPAQEIQNFHALQPTHENFGLSALRRSIHHGNPQALPKANLRVPKSTKADPTKIYASCGRFGDSIIISKCATPAQEFQNFYALQPTHENLGPSALRRSIVSFSTALPEGALVPSGRVDVLLRRTLSTSTVNLMASAAALVRK